MSNNSNTQNRELNLSRLLDAPVELVWKVFSHPEHISQWWGPNGFSNTIRVMEFRPGGNWEFTMHGPDGTDYINHNVFIEIIENERIVYDHVSDPKHITTVTFEAQGNKTLITWHMLFDTEELRKHVVQIYKADIGLTQNIAKLNTYLINQQ